jgi:hypothetical protein
VPRRLPALLAALALAFFAAGCDTQDQRTSQMQTLDGTWNVATLRVQGASRLGEMQAAYPGGVQIRFTRETDDQGTYRLRGFDADGAAALLDRSGRAAVPRPDVLTLQGGLPRNVTWLLDIRGGGRVEIGTSGPGNGGAFADVLLPNANIAPDAVVDVALEREVFGD